MKYNYCPICGKRSHKIGKHYHCDECKFVLWQNPKTCVGAIMISGGKILLTQRAEEPYKGDWDTPGGFLEEYETPEDGLKREMMEELGIKIKIKEIMYAIEDYYPIDKDKQGIVSLFYFVEPKSKKFKLGSDVSGYQWFRFNKIPKNIPFKSIRKAIKKAKKWTLKN